MHTNKYKVEMNFLLNSGRERDRLKERERGIEREKDEELPRNRKCVAETISVRYPICWLTLPMLIMHSEVVSVSCARDAWLLNWMYCGTHLVVSEEKEVFLKRRSKDIFCCSC